MCFQRFNYVLPCIFYQRFSAYFRHDIHHIKPITHPITGAGALDLAVAVERASKLESKFAFLYDVTLPIEAKIEKICTDIYRADGIELSGVV